jgi:hypothetical protein
MTSSIIIGNRFYRFNRARARADSARWIPEEP